MRERLSRITSHEMRTPLTIAIGYTDHLLVGESDPGRGRTWRWSATSWAG